MTRMMPSTKYPDYYRMPEFFGIVFAPWRRAVKRFWGKRHMIEFLIALTNRWTLNMYEQQDEAGNFTPILLGDISPEGGTNRWDKVRDHSSHKRGVDVDLYVCRKDGAPEKTHCRQEKTYDRERTTALAKAVFRAAGRHNVDKFYYEDQPVITAVSGLGTIQPWTNHLDHFHIRLKG